MSKYARGISIAALVTFAACVVDPEELADESEDVAELTATGDSSLTVAKNSSGTLEYFYRASSGEVVRVIPSNDGNRSVNLGGSITDSPVAITNADGRLEVFGRGQDGAIWSTAQTSPGASTWTGFRTHGGLAIGAPTVNAGFDGRLEIFIRGVDNAVWHRAQQAANGAWGDWSSLGGAASAPPVVVNGHVAVRGGSGTVSLIVRSSTGWSGWTSLGGWIADRPVLVVSSDGRLEVFGRGRDNAVWRRWQTSPGGSWSNGWHTLGGILTGPPSVTRHAYGTYYGQFEVMGRGNDGSIWSLRIGAGGSWTSLERTFGPNVTAASESGHVTAFAFDNDSQRWYRRAQSSQTWAGARWWNPVGEW